MKKGIKMELKIVCPNCQKEINAHIENKKLPKGNYYLVPESLMETSEVLKSLMEQEENPKSKTKDPIEKSILEHGYIPNNNLYRRWIMAQTLRHSRGLSENQTDYNKFDKYFCGQKPYRYAWDTTLNEIKALSHLTGDELKKRERFFNLETPKKMAKEYLERFPKYLKKLPEKEKNNKRQKLLFKYKHIPFTNINTIKNESDKMWFLPKDFNAITEAELIQKINKVTEKIFEANNYYDMRRALEKFIKECPMNTNMPKPDAWKNAFKGAGAYYTMDNMIKFHNCRWLNKENNKFLSMYQSLAKLEQETDKYAYNMYNEYYKLYAVMCDFVKYNNFDFNKRMQELYSTK